MPNEVIIYVRAIDQTKPVFDRIRREAREAGGDIGTTLTTHVSERMERDANQGGYTRVGDAIGETISQRVADTITRKVRERVDNDNLGGTSRDRNGRLRDSRGRFITGARSDNGGGRDRDKVTVHVDVDRKSILATLFSVAKEAGAKIKETVTGGLTTGLQTVLSGDFITSLIKVGVLNVLASIIAPALAAAISSAILLALGGGVIAAGIASALQDPQIMAAAKDVGGRFKDMWTDFGENFKGPIAGTLEKMLDVLDQLDPLVDNLGRTFGPVVELLGTGLVGFLQNALPGILRAADAAGPVWAELAESLPQLGDDIGRFFDHIKNSGPEATLFVNDFVAALGILIRILGSVIETLATLYAVARDVFLGLLSFALTTFYGILGAAEAAFGWIPGIGPKLASAKGKVADFQVQVNAELAKIHDKQITVTIVQVFKVVGEVVADIGSMIGKASGGVVGGAATGGLRSGLTWVGEHGPELVDMAPGSRVHSNPDSRRMAADSAGGGGGPIAVNLHLDGTLLATAMIDPQRKFVKQEFGGDVQAAWGF